VTPRLPATDIVYASEALTAFWRKGESPWTLVVFEGAAFVGPQDDLPRRSFIERNNLSAVVIAPNRRSWYPASETLPCVEAIRSAVGSAPLVTFGSSMGAYGAIKFAGALRARHVVALAPQFSIDPNVARASSEPWTINFRPELNAKMEISAKDVGCPVDIVFDPTCGVDLEHVTQILKRVNCRLIHVRNAGHGVEALFGGPTALLDLIRLLAADNLVAVADLARRNKRSSVYFHFSLYGLLCNRKPRIARWALDKAVSLPPLGTTDRLLRASAHVKFGQLETAAADLLRAYERTSGAVAKASVASAISSVLFGLSRNVEAVAWLRKTVAIAPDDELRRTALALGLIRAGALPEAEAILTDVAARFETPEAQFGLSQVLALQDKTGEAIVAGLRAITMRPAYHIWRAHVAALLTRAGREAEGTALIEAAVRAVGDYGAWLEWSKVLHRQGRRDEAMAACRRGLDLAPSYLPLRAHWAELLGECASTDEQMAFCAETERDWLGGSQCWIQLARALERQKKIPEAVMAARNAIAADPNSARVHAELLELMLRSDRIEDAVEAALAADGACGLPTAELHAAKGHLRMRLNDVEGAIAALQDAVGLAPDNARMHGLLARYSLNAGRLDVAEASARQALRLAPAAPWHDALIGALERAGRIQEAIHACRDAIPENPQRMEFVAKLASLLLASGDRAEAERAIASAVANGQANATLFTAQAEILASGGDVTGAVSAMRNGLAIDPHNARMHGLLAHYFLRLARFGEAEASAREALIIQPNAAWLHFQLSAALERQNRLAEAAEACRDAVQYAPDNAELVAKLAEFVERQSRAAAH
jgi:tetratricopeptide (TPR) repeat protein